MILYTNQQLVWGIPHSLVREESSVTTLGDKNFEVTLPLAISNSNSQYTVVPSFKQVHYDSEGTSSKIDRLSLLGLDKLVNITMTSDNHSSRLKRKMDETVDLGWELQDELFENEEILEPPNEFKKVLSTADYTLSSPLNKDGLNLCLESLTNGTTSAQRGSERTVYLEKAFILHQMVDIVNCLSDYDLENARKTFYEYTKVPNVEMAVTVNIDGIGRIYIVQGWVMMEDLTQIPIV